MIRYFVRTEKTSELSEVTRAEYIKVAQRAGYLPENVDPNGIIPEAFHNADTHLYGYVDRSRETGFTSFTKA